MRRDARGFGGADAARHAIVTWEFNAEDKIASAGRAYRGDHFGDEACAACHIAAVFVFTCVGPGRQKLVKQMTVPGGNFHAAEAATLQPRGGLREVVVHAMDFIDGQRSRYCAA